MKKLDCFSRFERNIYYIAFILLVVVLPIILVMLVDEIFFEEAEWFIRYPILFVCWLIFLGLGIMLAETIKGTFNLIRKIFGKKPLKTIEAELKEELFEKEYKAEKRAEERFMNLLLDRKLYWLWSKQNKEFEFLKTKVARLENLLIFALALLVILFIWNKL